MATVLWHEAKRSAAQNTYTFGFQLETVERMYYLMASSIAQLEEWIEAIRYASKLPLCASHTLHADLLCMYHPFPAILSLAGCSGAQAMKQRTWLSQARL